MGSPLPDLRDPLSEAEQDLLGDFLLDRIDEDSVKPGDDEGIFEISGLDGFFTAIVSGPVTIPPSQWLPSLWGEFPPVFETREEFEVVFSLLIRHMNSIAVSLMEGPDDFEPLFYQRTADGRSFTIVDEWCEGYMRGIELARDLGASLNTETRDRLVPIRAFTEAADWPGHDFPKLAQRENLQRAISPNVRWLYAYWREHRMDPVQPLSTPYQRSEPRVGRNDQCPCGSGKKFKKCCLN